MTRAAGHGEQQLLSLTMHTCTRTSHTHPPLLNMLRPLSCTPLLLYSTTHISFIKPSNIHSLPHTQRAYILHTQRAVVSSLLRRQMRSVTPRPRVWLFAFLVSVAHIWIQSKKALPCHLPQDSFLCAVATHQQATRQP